MAFRVRDVTPPPTQEQKAAIEVAGEITSTELPKETLPEYELDIAFPEGTEKDAFLGLSSQLQAMFSATIRNLPLPPARMVRPPNPNVALGNGSIHGGPPSAVRGTLPIASEKTPYHPPVRAEKHVPPSLSLKRRPEGTPPNAGMEPQSLSGGPEKRQRPSSLSHTRRPAGSPPNVVKT
jgi:hypothetical protein